MKIVSRLIAALALVALTGSVFAQSVSVGSKAGQAGTQVVLEPSFTAGASPVDAIAFVVTFANPALANFSDVTVVATCGGALGTATACAVSPTKNAFQIQVAGASAFADGILASITFSIDAAAAAPQDIALVVNQASVVIGFSGAPVNPPVPVSDGNIEITTGPQAAYSDSLAPDPMALLATEQGGANPTGTVTVTNTGEATSTLAGACTYSGDTQMSIANGAFSLGKDASQVATLTCNASAEGSYSGTISCTHDAGNVASPVTHAATCVVPPPGQAIYASVPTPGSTIDMTPGTNPPAGTPVADSVLGISNAATDSNDLDLELLTCGYTGDTEITATAPGSTTLAPMTGTSVTFSCDSTTAGTYTGTYSCAYDESGNNEPNGTASYTVNCDVREAASDIKESPDSGKPLSIAVPQFGSGETNVSFTEILDENIAATVDSCSFTDGTVFSVVTALPLDVASGGTVQVVVEGQDPGDGSVVVTDTLTCLYTDSDSTPGTASWPISLNVQTTAIPTLSTWGLIAMFLTMLGLGGIVIRRRQLS